MGGILTWLARGIVWTTLVVQWPCQVGWLALTTKNRNCSGFYMKTLFLVEYHFALHPPFNFKFNIISIKCHKITGFKN